MKKLILACVFALTAAWACAANLNVMTTSGELISGELIGSDENEVYIKTADGKAKTIKTAKIKKVFDADTKADVTAQYKSAAAQPAETAKPAQATPVPAKEPAYAPAAPSSSGRVYQTVEEDSGTIDLNRGASPFKRTIPKYVGFDFSISRINVLISDQNRPLREAMSQYYAYSAYDTFDPASTIMFSYSFDMDLYVRPFDWLIIGGFAGITPIGQNYSVHSGGYEYLYVDMPLTQYGVLVKLIPYSKGKRWNGEPLEDQSLALNCKLGTASLGTFFSNASINNENVVGDAVDLSGTGPYMAFEFEYSVDMAVAKFTLGYQRCLIEKIQATAPYPGITDSRNYLYYNGSLIPFSADGFYVMMNIGI